MDKMKRVVGIMLLHRDPVPLVICAAVITLAWGVILASSDAFATNPSYRLLACLGEEWFVGGVLIVLGVAKLLAVAYSRHKALRWLMLFSTVTWGALAGGVAATWIDNAVPPLYAAIGLMSLWAYLMLGVNGRE